MNSPENKNHQSDDAFSGLRDALNDEHLEQYLANEGPLTISELPVELRRSEAFEEFVNQYDWPSRANAADIAPVLDYDGAEDFWLNLYKDKNDGKYLNNFKYWLVHEPIETPAQMKGMLSAYGLQPALHRAHVVAEPLFSSLRVVLQERPGCLSPTDDTSVADELAVQHPEVTEAAYAAYRLLGRLMTKDDTRMASKTLTGTEGAEEDLTSAHDALWR